MKAEFKLSVSVSGAEKRLLQIGKFKKKTQMNCFKAALITQRQKSSEMGRS